MQFVHARNLAAEDIETELGHEAEAALGIGGVETVQVVDLLVLRAVLEVAHSAVTLEVEKFKFGGDYLLWLAHTPSSFC